MCLCHTSDDHTLQDRHVCEVVVAMHPTGNLTVCIETPSGLAIGINQCLVDRNMFPVAIPGLNIVDGVLHQGCHVPMRVREEIAQPLPGVLAQRSCILAHVSCNGILKSIPQCVLSIQRLRCQWHLELALLQRSHICQDS